MDVLKSSFAIGHRPDDDGSDGMMRRFHTGCWVTANCSGPGRM